MSKGKRNRQIRQDGSALTSKIHSGSAAKATVSERPFESNLISMTTIINAHVSGGIFSQGSGFYYQVLAPKDPNVSGGQWRRIDGQWLITNRHVAFPIINGAETVPEEFIFNIRKIENGRITWVPLTLDKAGLLKNARMHNDTSVDVVAINVEDIIKAKQAEIGANNKDLAKINEYIWPYSLNNDNLPKDNMLRPEIGSDILIASYPKGFYDDYNQFPIVKSGVISSGWGLSFKGKRNFIVDVKLFSGSSGGLVISKPTHSTIKDGRQYFSAEKQFLLLGVYSGEYLQPPQQAHLDGMIIQKQDDYGLGIVWYADIIDEIVNSGISYNS